MSDQPIEPYAALVEASASVPGPCLPDRVHLVSAEGTCVFCGKEQTSRAGLPESERIALLRSALKRLATAVEHDGTAREVEAALDEAAQTLELTDD